MVATTSTILPIASLGPDPEAKASKLRVGFTNLGGQVKANGQQAPVKINGIARSTTTGVLMGSLKIDNNELTLIPSAEKQWGTLLSVISSMFVEAEKIDLKPKQPDTLTDRFDLGGLVGDSLVFRQNFFIRSYEIGPDGFASIETLMNHLQEVALSHSKRVGLSNVGFGSTLEMTKQSLIWVIAKMQVVIDRYPAWGDVVQVDSWRGAAGKNGMSCDWIFRDVKSGDILARASSVMVMMNKETRRLSRFADAVRRELQPIFTDSTTPVEEIDCRKLNKLNDSTADYIIKGIAPRWADLDVNQHVNNVKYVSWIIESTPPAILESYELSMITLEYRKECGKDSLIQALSSVTRLNSGNAECQHTLRLENQAEILRGRTKWRPKLNRKL